MKLSELQMQLRHIDKIEHAPPGGEDLEVYIEGDAGQLFELVDVGTYAVVSTRDGAYFARPSEKNKKRRAIVLA